jgi:hypothetical protein
MFLDDGTCLPSYLGVQERGVIGSGASSQLNDITLHLGEVKKIVYASDDNSYGKGTTEYDVEVQHRDGNGGFVTAMFRGCTISTLFGSVADRVYYTLRPDSNPNGTDEVVGVGAKVALLCLNGNQQKPIIIAAVEDQTEQRVEVKDAGHNLFFEFNGIRFIVDKDGQGILTFRGATNVDGTLTKDADANAEGTTLSFLKDGSVQIALKDDDQHLKVDRANKKIDVKAQDNYSLDSGGTVTTTAQDSVTFDTKNELDVTATNNVKIKSAGVLVGAATDNWMKGTTYRSAEQSMHAQMVSLLTGISTALVAAAAGLAAGPPGLGAAAAAIGTAAAQLAALSGTIGSFEAQAPTFLSLVNKGD